MTFDTIVSRVMKRLNLTSEDARVRIGEFVNDRYKSVVSAIGLDTSLRKEVTLLVDPTIETDLPNFIVPNMEKVIRVVLLQPIFPVPPPGPTPVPDPDKGFIQLAEMTWEEVTSNPNFHRAPRGYAIKRVGTSQVVITLDAWPDSEGFYLRIEGYEKTSVLVDDAEPDFPEDFHDLLVEGGKADEYIKMEKVQLASIAEAKYEKRLSDLRMFIAKSAFKSIYQGKDKPNQLWYRPWSVRISRWD